jgi:hypothetical protein
MERKTTKELMNLLELKRFPSQELITVRKDMKSYRDTVLQTKLERNEEKKPKISSNCLNTLNIFKLIPSHRIIPEYDDIIDYSNFEKHVVEKKHSLFFHRRVEEEEARLLFFKKQAKSRAIKNAQARDISSFANQKRF